MANWIEKRYVLTGLAPPGGHNTSFRQSTIPHRRWDLVQGMELFEEEHFILLAIALGVGPELYWLPKAVIVHKGSRSIQQVAVATLIELYHHKTEFFSQVAAD